MDDESGLTSRTTQDRPSLQGIAAPVVNTGERYRLGEMLGRGGMGEVLDAHDDQIGRDVAIKRLRAEHPSEKQIARFMREARIQGRLEHPAIVPVHELAIDANGKPYFAMKKLAGTNLAEILKQTTDSRASANTLGKYPRQRLLRAVADVCLAVELAHQRGFVHRDLKPDNIVLGEYGETYVIDWGVAKVTGEDESAFVLEGDQHELVTAVGATVGTPGYMSPEQASAQPDVDGRADVYSLGCILFEILAGSGLHPKGKPGMQSAVIGVDGRPSHRAPDRDIPPELDELCAQATATDRAKRIPTARALGEQIQQFLDGDRDLEQRRQLAAQHLKAAQQAFAGNDRARAMREAGRALALDPTTQKASALITKMIIEPPAELPAEVQREFDGESAEVIRRTLDVGVMASSGYLLFIPLLGLIGGVAPEILAVVTGAALVSVGLLLWMRRAGTRLFIPPLVIAQLILIATVSRMYTPFLLGPGLAAVTASGLMTGPQYAKRQATLIVVLTSCAVLVPVLAELVGWIDRSFVVGPQGATIFARMGGETATFVTLTLFTIALTTSSVIITRGMRHAERRARRSMHVQAWQLRQLVADEA